jgi:hypothetical protein
MDRSTITHLRIPFSIFLLPVFLFALSQSDGTETKNAWLIFVILHFLLYPASNAYNSYYDKDEGSIGLIKNPPPVTKKLLYTAWALDIVALIIAWAGGLGWFFIGYLVVYGAISKAYSHPSIRLKKYPITSLILVSTFQGFLTYLAITQSLVQLPPAFLLHIEHLLPAAITTTNLLAVYPITQIYQHDEDKKRGDLTYSRMIGIGGTFLNAAVFFSLSFLGFILYFYTIQQEASILLLAACMGPVMIFFSMWWLKTNKNPSLADYTHTMYLNALASFCLNLFFGLLCLKILD